MSQSAISKFYHTRKRLDNQTKPREYTSKSVEVTDEVFIQASKEAKSTKTKQEKKLAKNEKSTSVKPPKKVESKRTTKNKKILKPPKGQTVVTNFYTSGKTDDDLQTQSIEKNKDDSWHLTYDSPEKTQPEIQSVSVVKKVSDEAKTDSLCRSPKRNLPEPKDSTPTKKKPLPDTSKETSLEKQVESHISSPVKQAKLTRRKLQLAATCSIDKNQLPVENATSITIGRKQPSVSPFKLDSSDPRFSKWKEQLEKFTEKTQKLKEYHLSSSKITSVISPSKSEGLKCALPSKPAYERFRSLTEQESTLALPPKYKLLLEMFRSLETVISILHNRKEAGSFEKVQDGVQRMIRKNFTKDHLAQIATVLPNAYTLSMEKCNFISKKADTPDYMLVIAPNVHIEGSGKNAFVSMSPQCLLSRRKEFNDSLLNITKKHHQEFLRSIHFPPVPENDISQWHPKFLLTQVPDIELTKLPEVPGTKICTAKDVLNKVKGKLRGKIVQALESVAEESSSPGITLDLKPSPVTPKIPATKSALKGICTDLLEKVRAREAAKILEKMVRSPEETKQLAMMEKLPKIVNVLWHYFIAERKAAIPVDTAIEKIVYSLKSFETPDEIKEYLNLIIQKFPNWIKFVEIRKGTYIIMDKKINISDMVEKFKANL